MVGYVVVSVPLRGKGRDQLYYILELRPTKITFPSPCGEKVGINCPIWVILPANLRSGAFPSPCGEKVGINHEVRRN